MHSELFFNYLNMQTVLISTQVLLEEAWDSYDPDIVQQLTSNNLADVDTNLQSITSWLKSWHTDNDTDVDR